MTRTPSLERLVRATLLDGARVRLDLDAAAIARAAELVRDAVLAGKKVLLCGNGGSAADAQHIAAELIGRFVIERRPLAAIALTTDSSALTAIANDYGYEHVFSRQVEALGAEGDVLVAITTSGTSRNVVAAVAAARVRGMKVIGLTGGKGAAFIAACDAGVAVPSVVVARIQECHITIGHLLCEAIDAAFAGAGEQLALPVAGPAAGDVGALLDHALLGDPGFAKLRTLDQAISWRDAQRAHKRTVVWTNGVFDVLHVGHLASLRGARQFGDALIVGVNGDASVRASKGPERPIFRCEERVALLAALELVDAILVFDDPTPERVLAQIKPDVHVKGADYAPPDGKPVPERAIVEAYGGRVEFLPLVPGRSSTETLARLRS
ncbi:MAG TPA: SIS domain-containing protein [Kofleriaceae bacterium]|jgi:phosphoheptose isomerase|nr:SIS domain-containing protein [Kofleriaceae bacterium]